MCTTPQLDYDLFRILLCRKGASELLLDSAPDGFRLPVVAIPAHARIAEEVTAAVKRLWDLDAYCLFPLSPPGPANAQLHVQVAESCEPEANAPPGMRWLPVTSLSTGAFADACESEVVERSLALLDDYRQGRLSGAFARPGWLQEVTEWIQTQAASAGLKLNGNFRQLNAGPTFSLIRFETDGPALWFKAAGKPNLKEYSATHVLAKHFPAYIPRLMASREDWNAWLSFEVEGVHLTEKTDIATWRKTAQALAELQISSSGQGLHLLDAGLRDVRTGSLLSLTGPFFDLVTELMTQQEKKSPPPLSFRELRDLRNQLEQELQQFAQSEIPDTIGHFDFNSGNILIKEDQCVFLDFAAAGVGHPFLSLEYLLEQFRKLHGTTEEESALVSTYTDAWLRLVPEQTIRPDLALAPLVAVFAYAASSQAWRDSKRLEEPSLRGHLRSLTRRMHREACLRPGLARHRPPCSTLG